MFNKKRFCSSGYTLPAAAPLLKEDMGASCQSLLAGKKLQLRKKQSEKRQTLQNITKEKERSAKKEERSG